MHRKQRFITWIAVLIVAVPWLASAAWKGRLIGRVVDPEGKPIEGVSVTATSPDVAGFEALKTTDRKGTFVIDFDRIYVTYHYKFEKAGYQAFETDQDWSLEGKARHDFVMHPSGAPTVDGPQPASTSDPAVLAYSGGVAAVNARDFANAQAMFEKAVAHDPELRQAWTALSVVHLELKHYQEAVEAAEKAIALGATDEAVLRCRWEAYRHLGDEAKTAEALKDLERHGRTTEEAKRVYNEGVALAKSDDHAGAFARFTEAAEMNPNLKEALVGVAVEGLEIKRYDEALGAAEALLQDDPHNDQALRLRYNASLGIGNQDLIADALMGLSAVEPVVARDSLLHLAFDAYDANDMVRAKDLFAKVLEVDPNQPHSHYYLGLIYVNEDAKAEAKSHLERFVELAPDQPDAATARELIKFLGTP